MTTKQQLDEDFAGLQEAFKLGRGFCSAETIRVFAVHHRIIELMALEWIEPATNGRWLQGYAPIGDLAATLGGTGFQPVPSGQSAPEPVL